MLQVEIIVEAMKNGSALEDITDASKSGQLIVNIFIRACVAAITSKDLASDLTSVRATAQHMALCVICGCGWRAGV
jgi:hypothetical protein|eukprot:COSAG01_NODE_574_length_15291_cov_18.398368_7_plen_76_part_00